MGDRLGTPGADGFSPFSFLDFFLFLVCFSSSDAVNYLPMSQTFLAPPCVSRDSLFCHFFLALFLKKAPNWQSLLTIFCFLLFFFLCLSPWRMNGTLDPTYLWLSCKPSCLQNCTIAPLQQQQLAAVVNKQSGWLNGWKDRRTEGQKERRKEGSKSQQKGEIRGIAVAIGHIMLNTPVLVRSLKLSSIEPG